jgi:hypothetical protein
MSVEERLERVERQSRWQRAFLVILMVGIVFLLVAGQTPAPSASETLRVAEVEIVDDEGNVVVRLGATEAGQGSVVTFNARGEELISVGATTVDGKGVISVADEKGRKLLWLGATVDGAGLIASFDHFGAVKARWP